MYFRQTYENVVFVVASDDQLWCHTHLNDRDVDFTLNPQRLPQDNVAIDLAILASCNHTIMSYGTYSFWAAYLKQSGTTLFFEHQNFPFHVDEINDEVTQWIPWKDPCITVDKNHLLKFKSEGPNCTKY
jgi:hypothetical protein